MEVFNRFHQVNAGSWSYTGYSDALSLFVNKAVLFHGVRLFGNSGGDQYTVNFTIKNENVTGTYTSELDGDNCWGYDVMLPKPISLQANEAVTIVARIDGPSTQYGQLGKASVAVNDIVVTFIDAPSNLSTNSTDRDRGQFYKIYLLKR